MRRRLQDPLLAAGPLAVAALAAASTLAGALALAVLVSVAARAAFPGRRRRRTRPAAPVVVVAPLAPRRPRARPRVSVAAVARGGAPVRALRPSELHGGRVRRGAPADRVADPALRQPCLQVGTRANAHP